MYCTVVHDKLGFGRVLKCSLSAHWMQQLFLSLLIWTADCKQFLSEKTIFFGRFGFSSDFLYPNPNGILFFRTPLLNRASQSERLPVPPADGIWDVMIVWTLDDKREATRPDCCVLGVVSQLHIPFRHMLTQISMVDLVVLMN